MARIVSFVLLVAILLFFAVLFFQVLAEFLLPLFLAVLIAVLFSPIHEAIRRRIGNRDRWAAAISLALVILLILGPLLAIVIQAGREGAVFYRHLQKSPVDLQAVAEKVAMAGQRVGITLDAHELQQTVVARLQQWLGPLAVSTTQTLGNILIGLIVMLVCLYFFLADGPGMARDIVRLIPIDEKYQEQLIGEFSKVTRAVVLANVAAAAVQAMLLAIGLHLASVQPVFLLAVLTMLLAMIPFVGAAAVWLPVSAWLVFIEQRTGAGIMLGLYGACVVSTIDNVIKPYILHGSSNLHPLLALLSVLGGVKALGPIGIFVGPMAIVFLLTMLKIVQRELQEMSAERRETKAGPTGRS